MWVLWGYEVVTGFFRAARRDAWMSFFPNCVKIKNAVFGPKFARS